MKSRLWVVMVVAASLGLGACQTTNNEGTATQCSGLSCQDASEDGTGEEDSAAEEDGTATGSDMASEEDGVSVAPLVATESNEAEIAYGWLAAGQPTEARLTEVVEAGAVIISLRLESEDPFDEPGLVASLGGTFIRYPTMSSSYDSVDFREAMYDLYDAQLEAGARVYLHCASSNRVGASWALYQAERKGVAAEEAISMGQAAGLTSLETRVREILGL